MPKTIEWDDSYNIGNPKLDGQHQRLFEMAKEFDMLESGPDEAKKMNVILNGLRDYMLYHFEEEETFMEKVRFPDINKHKVLHQRFINDMRSITRVPMRLNILKIRIHTFIQKWLVEHIVNEDMRIQSWAQRQKSNGEHIFDIDAP